MNDDNSLTFGVCGLLVIALSAAIACVAWEKSYYKPEAPASE